MYGAISYDGLFFLKVAPGTLNSQGYAEILDEAISKAKEKYLSFVWMQDNASIHRPVCVQEVFEKHDVEKLKAPARSPDLNPIENVWGMMVKFMDKFIDQDGEATSEDALFDRVIKAAEMVEKSHFVTLYQSMRNRMLSVMEKKWIKHKILIVIFK